MSFGEDGVMDLKQLEIVRAICAEGSFSNAARRLGVSQPTLSKAIAKLERALDVELFDRSGGVARPTAYGRFLAEKADEILKSVKSIHRELGDWANGDSGKLRIGIGPATRIKPLPELLTAIYREYPDLLIEIRHATGTALAKGVAEGKFDIALSYAANAYEFGDLMRIQLFSDQMVAAARIDHPIFDFDHVTSDVLLSYPLASMGVVAPFRAWVGTLTEAQERKMKAFVCEDDALIRSRLRETDYVAHGPSFLFADDVSAGLLRTRSIDWSERFDCWLLMTRGRSRSPLIKAIAQLARSIAE